MNNNLNMVTVVMITYNHSKFIKKAIESVLSQKTDFEFELIISDDGSSDNTAQIINDILKHNTNSNRIKYFKHKTNLGMKINSEYAYSKCKSKYVALCEGDDYWNNNEKLQKQFEFLENNSEFSCCGHLTKTIYESGVKQNSQFYLDTVNKKGELTKKDFMKVNKIHTSSLFFRTHLLNKILNKNFINYRDNLMKLFFLFNGKIKILDEVMSVYRKNSIGVSTNISVKEIYNAEIQTAINLSENLENFNSQKNLLISHWTRYYIINDNQLSKRKKISLFFSFLIPSFYNFPMNIKDIFSTIYYGFIKNIR